MKNGFAQADALLFDAVKEAAGPDELSGEDAERQDNGKHTGTGCGDHHDTQSEQGEADQNFEKALGLLKGSNNHYRSRF